jgi:hypothetical protein
MEFPNSGKRLANLTEQEAVLRIGIVTLDDIMQHGILNLLDHAKFIAVANTPDFSQFTPRNRTSEIVQAIMHMTGIRHEDVARHANVYRLGHDERGHIRGMLAFYHIGQGDEQYIAVGYGNDDPEFYWQQLLLAGQLMMRNDGDIGEKNREMLREQKEKNEDEASWWNWITGRRY